MEEGLPPLQESESEEDKEDGKEKAKAAPKHIDTEKQMLELAEAANTGKEKSKVKKKGGEDVMERIAEKKRKAAEQAEAQKNWFDLKVNTSVYVTGLPDDVDEGQLAEVGCSPSHRLLFSGRECAWNFSYSYLCICFPASLHLTTSDCLIQIVASLSNLQLSESSSLYQISPLSYLHIIHFSQLLC